ncbi:MAG TPA: hypothetical protein VF313_06915 [Anaerolineaceae bacterium]
MLKDLNSRLIDILEKLRARDRLQNRLAEVERLLSQEVTRLDGLDVQFAREKRDVQRLEGLSLGSIFYTVLGDKEQRLDRERQEFLAAKLQRDQCQYAISSLELDLADLKYKLSALGNLDSAYQALLERKEKILLSSENDLFHQLLDITGLQANLQADRKELQEAVGSGQTVLTILDGVINSLNSAEGWGNWDMLGGGMLADLAKHSKIDDARDQVHQAQELLRRFQRELADIQSAESFLIDISSFDTFVDFFLDSLIVDWIVQSKIHNSLERTTQVRQRVKVILQGLGTRLAENRGQLDNLIEQRKLLVENS